MIAILILALVILSFGTLLTQSYQGVFSAGYKSEAQYIGQEAMENLLAGITDYDAATSIEILTEEDLSLPLDFSVTPPVEVEGKKVTVKVTYTDAHGNQRTQIFVSFIPK